MSTQVFQYSLQVPQPQQTFIIMKGSASVVLAAPTCANLSKNYVVSKNDGLTDVILNPSDNDCFNNCFDDYPVLDVVEENMPFDLFPVSNNDSPNLQQSPALMNDDFWEIDDKFINEMLLSEDTLQFESYSLGDIELDQEPFIKQSPHSLSYTSSDSPPINDFDDSIVSSSPNVSPPDNCDDVSSGYFECQSGSPSFVESDFGESEDLADIYLLPECDNLAHSLEDELMFSLDEDLPTNISTPKRKSVFSPEERRERKKASNRCAAYRYRQKQRAKVTGCEGGLKEVVTELRKVQSSVNESRQTLDLLKKLAGEVIEARRSRRV